MLSLEGYRIVIRNKYYCGAVDLQLEAGLENYMATQQLVNIYLTMAHSPEKLSRTEYQSQIPHVGAPSMHKMFFSENFVSNLLIRDPYEDSRDFKYGEVKPT